MEKASGAKLCVMCGKEKATTVDHVPPKGIYPKPRPNNIQLNTVPACRKCNNESSAEDEIFKILIGLETGEHRENSDSVIESMVKTLDSNKRLAKEIFSTAKNVSFINELGMVSEATAVPFDTENYSKVISKMVRGLYWQEKGEILSENAKITVYPFRAMNPQFAESIKQLMNTLQPKFLNSKTFVYKVYFSEENYSVWGMQFFNEHKSFAYLENTI